MALKKQNPQSEPLDIERRTSPRDFEELTRQLNDPDPIVRRWGARDLAAFPDAARFLVERLLKEATVSVREVIFSSLTRIGNSVAVSGLVDCLRSEDANLRNEAIEALKQLPEEVGPIMEGLLHDPDPDVRIFAVNILESLKHPLVETWLIEVIGNDPHVNVCATAVDLLGEVGSSLAIPALTALRDRFSDEPYIGFAVDIAIKRCQTNGE